MQAFTDNYQDRSNHDGYQFEFFCERCGNGHQSAFKHSVTSMGGKLLRFGGDLVGGEWGNRASQLGWDSRWMRDGVRNGARDRALAEAVAEMRPEFGQCHRCGQWVCQDICWNGERGMCATCAPKLDQEVAGLQAEAQVQQLRGKINATDWTAGVAHEHEITARCPSCANDGGGGKYCRHCGTPLAASDEAQRFCAQCGYKLVAGTVYCGGCGTSAG